MPVLLGLIGSGTVATAAAGRYTSANLVGVGSVVGVFLAMHIALRIRAPHADPYLLPIVATLIAVGLVELSRLSPPSAVPS
jgi:hypothetical protein